MDPRLFEAIAGNDKNGFINLVQENDNFLEQRTVSSRSTVLHLASRFGHIELVMEILKLHPMVGAEDIKLETPLHEACRQGHTEILKLLLETNPWAAVKLNADNRSAFFIACCHGHFDLVKLLSNQSWLPGLEDERFVPTCLHVATSRGHTGVVRELLNVLPHFVWKVDGNGLPVTKDFGDPPNKENSEAHSPHHQVEEANKIQNDNTAKPDSSLEKKISSLTNLQLHKVLSRRQRVKLTKLHNDRRSREKETHREALQNARNTIILVAILIATVTFTAGLSPPGGGVYQQESSIGNSSSRVAGATPFKSWLAVSFVATSYVVATWIILPHGHWKEWILAISAATMGTLFFCLGVVLARHWLRKSKWVKDNGKTKKKGIVALAPTEGKTQSQSAKPDIKLDIKSHSTNSNTRDVTRSESKSNSSTNSDVSSCRGLGYHAY
ncbi:ankyrin repeat-containing protein itn1 [Quercus suber]|uniref:Ankyrin repeat-containing protein itn1 n=1 Tax=Quercus suber TaxID=58331 RepID=A0AAW0L154_QUESU